jgi:3-oxoacyl-[acyl-carrier protein] reductase
MTFDFSRKRIIVCGGSKGIGRAIALGFAETGAAVSICARGAEALETTRRELGSNGHSARCDLGDRAAVTRYVEEAVGALGGLDVLVNNASGFGLGDDDAAWDQGFSVDIMATVRASRAAVPHIEKAGGGAIVNISSIAAFRASTRTSAYAAVKAALVSYTASQAAAFARQNIRVNCIAPGSIEFPGGTWERRRTEQPDLYNRILKSIPFGRLGYPEEIANVALFLASPLANWVTGQTLSVDGGQLLGG